ncbi:hypothetical protein A2U01_0087392, partial [Trifolium medium]|nr:hypothetical protein [Trifolium medium]
MPTPVIAFDLVTGLSTNNAHCTNSPSLLTSLSSASSHSCHLAGTCLFLVENDIEHEVTTPYTPQHN